ncbi:MAG: GNAT family N-acetyltransferase [Sphaerochaetaceae bacterium]
MKEKAENTINIRKVAKSDAVNLIEYLNKVSCESDFLTFGAGEFVMSVEEEERFIENTFRKENDLFIVAETNNEIVGTLSFATGPRKRTAHVGEFGMSVIKKHWGIGVGTKLINYLISWAKESKRIRKINLKVRSDNERAIHLYKKMGFVEEGLRKRDLFVNDKFYDTLLMGKCID